MEHLARIPKNRIAVLIGKSGSTRKMIEKACGASLHIESKSGDVSVNWPDEGSDPVIKMKLPDVIFAIGSFFFIACRVKIFYYGSFFRQGWYHS